MKILYKGVNLNKGKSEFIRSVYYIGARYYWSGGGLWLSVDPLADRYLSTSPYLFCFVNPVKFIDYNGKDTIIFDRWGRFSQRIPGKEDEIVFVRGTSREVSRGMFNYGKGGTLRKKHKIMKISNNAIDILMKSEPFKGNTMIHVHEPNIGKSLFEFFYANTIVEWGYNEISNKEIGNVFGLLYTSHFLGRIEIAEGSSLWDILYKENSGYEVLLDVHTHKPDLFGFNLRPSRKDYESYNLILNKGKHYSAKFYIYVSGKYRHISHENILRYNKR